MAELKTNAENLTELDLALLEVGALTVWTPEYHPGSRISIVQMENELTNILSKCAFIDHSIDFDGRADVESEWARMRREKPEGLNDYSTHNLYPFEGKMMPQLARALINICTRGIKGVVLDPFCGSGTVPLEAALLGHTAIAGDLDPFAVWLTAAKLAPTGTIIHNLLEKLHYPADYITLREKAHALCHHTSDYSISETGAEELLTSNGGNADAIVTSPPYFNAIDYHTRHNDWRASLGLGKPNRQSTGVSQTVDAYEAEIKLLTKAMAKSLTPGGKVAIVIGDHEGVPSTSWYELGLKASGLRLHTKMIRPYRRPTRSFSDEVILIMEKPA